MQRYLQRGFVDCLPELACISIPTAQNAAKSVDKMWQKREQIYLYTYMVMASVELVLVKYDQPRRFLYSYTELR